MLGGATNDEKPFALRNFIRKHASTRTPIARLSDDLLYLIFLEVKNSEVVYRSRKAAPILSHVCRFFRKVVLDAPLLWNDVYMHCVRTPQNHCWVVAHMRRSKKCMVDLNLFATRALATHEIDFMLTKHGKRIRTLTVRASHSSLARVLWQQLHDTMSSLESFRFSASMDIVLHAMRDPPKEPFPFQVPFVFRNLGLSWAEWNTIGLTTLALKWINPADRLPLEDLRIMLLTCSTTLRCFEYVGISPYSNPTSSIPPVTLPALETLTLAYADSFNPLMQLLHVPNLRSFSLRDLFFSPDFQRPFPWLSRNANPTDIAKVFGLIYSLQLREFAISGVRYSPFPKAFSDFLLSQRRLESLSIYGCLDKYHRAVFDLTVDAKDMLPALSHLHIAFVENDIADQVLSFLGRRADSKLTILDKLTLAKNSESFIMSHLDHFTEAARMVSVVSDPVYQLHIPLDEKTIITEGKLFITPTPPSSPDLVAQILLN
ncbi:hypothetical protein H0H87_011635 [Tephrocybe sp. NHM501043]|nr:hypothetical protein H0H87_011635 [Tephrocybe sp. NHM501043]